MKYLPFILLGSILLLWLLGSVFFGFFGSEVLLIIIFISIFISWLIVCFCQSLKCKWQKFDFFIFASPLILLMCGICDNWDGLEDYLVVYLLTIPVISRFIVMRKSLNSLIQFLFARDNYFKTLILIFAAIITLCILFITYRYLNPPRRW